MSINTKQEAQKPSRIDCKIPSRASQNDKQEEAEGDQNQARQRIRHVIEVGRLELIKYQQISR